MVCSFVTYTGTRKYPYRARKRLEGGWPQIVTKMQDRKCTIYPWEKYWVMWRKHCETMQARHREAMWTVRFSPTLLMHCFIILISKHALHADFSVISIHTVETQNHYNSVYIHANHNSVTYTIVLGP